MFIHLKMGEPYKIELNEPALRKFDFCAFVNNRTPPSPLGMGVAETAVNLLPTVLPSVAPLINNVLGRIIPNRAEAASKASSAESMAVLREIARDPNADPKLRMEAVKALGVRG